MYVCLLPCYRRNTENGWSCRRMHCLRDGVARAPRITSRALSIPLIKKRLKNVPFRQGATKLTSPWQHWNCTISCPWMECDLMWQCLKFLIFFQRFLKWNARSRLKTTNAVFFHSPTKESNMIIASHPRSVVFGVQQQVTMTTMENGANVLSYLSPQHTVARNQGQES